jgi:hypothetical protein
MMWSWPCVQQGGGGCVALVRLVPLCAMLQQRVALREFMEQRAKEL